MVAQFCSISGEAENTKMFKKNTAPAGVEVIPMVIPAGHRAVREDAS